MYKVGVTSSGIIFVSVFAEIIKQFHMMKVWTHTHTHTQPA